MVAAGLLAYHNSFTGPFIFDDSTAIVQNPTIRHLWPIWQPLSPPHQATVQGRPVVNLSLAINYAIGGLDVRGYHALNVAIHILAGLTLFGVVRRTLLQPKLSERFGTVADELALAVAVLWTVHPLQTEAVTYVIQRCESLMGLFFLLTLYCFIRGAGSPRPRWWYGLCVSACALGMASKEVMVAAPLIILLYDWVFLGSSFRELWRRRTALYAGLAATWLILAALVVTTPHVNTGLGIEGLTPWSYLKTEAGVILYYLRLCVWPDPLVIDYLDWPIARSLKDYLIPGMVVAGLLGTTVWAFRRRPWLGFLGAWFFLILAPTSSFLPSLGEVVAERRMYLPLAAVVVLAVMAIYAWAGRRSMPVYVVLAAGLGFLTVQRNDDYRSELAIWADAVAKRPDSARTQYSVGLALAEAGRVGEAIGHYDRALRIKPDLPYVHYELGLALAKLGRVQEAVAHWKETLRLKPDYAEAHNNLGLALVQLGDVQEGIEHYDRALRIKPDYAEAYNNLGVALAQTGRIPEAVDHFEQALRIKPEYAEAECNLGLALSQAGKLEEGIEHYEQALRINPNYAAAHYNLGAAFEQAGRVGEAVSQYEQALRGKPDFEAARNRLARLQGGG